MAIAMAASVTVSMLALMMGMDRRISDTNTLEVCTSPRLRIADRFGASSTSSKVKPVSCLSFIYITSWRWLEIVLLYED